MAVERKSSIRKAPAADVVDVLTSKPEPQSVQRQSMSPAVVDVNPGTDITRPGPGRPRSKKRMEPFSSKIEMGLRDELDTYIFANGTTIVDFLDEAIRNHLKR